MRKIRSSKLYQYLRDKGVLDGTDEEIQEAKKEYRKIQKKLQKRAYRKRKKHTEVILEKEEYECLNSKAREYGYSLPNYIKKSALCYTKRRYLTPHPSSILEIKELIYKTYNEITHIANQEKGKWLGMMNNYDILKNRILEVYETTQATFQNPHLLEDVIQYELKNNPEFLPKLKKMVQDYDSEI